MSGPPARRAGPSHRAGEWLGPPNPPYPVNCPRREAHTRKVTVRVVRLPAASVATIPSRWRPALRRLAGTRIVKDARLEVLIRLPSSVTVTRVTWLELETRTRDRKLREAQALGTLALMRAAGARGAPGRPST